MRMIQAGRRFTERGGHGVDIRLTSMRSNQFVFWSARGNSYVVVRDGAVNEPEKFRILSINGIGEIRWTVEDWNRDAESEEARAYFFGEGGR